MSLISHSFKVNFNSGQRSSSVEGVLRGLHFQFAAHAQSKRSRVKGAVLDVAVDINASGSPNLRPAWVAVGS